MIYEKLMKLHIKDRIVLMFMTISICSVLLCMVITTVIGVYSNNREAKRALALNTELLASRNAAALAFDNPDFSTDSLKLLKEQQNIMAGCILGKEGVFAYYGDLRIVERCEDLPRDWRGFFKESVTSDAHSVVAVRNIYSEGEWVGGIMLISNQQRLYDYLYSQLSWALLIIAAVISASFLLATLLQGYISKPIMDVITVTENFSKKQELSQTYGGEKSYEYDRVINALNNIMHFANDRVKYHQAKADNYASALKKSGESLQVMSKSLKDIDDATVMVNALLEKKVLGTHIRNYESYIKDIRDSLKQYKSRIDAVSAVSGIYEKCLEDGLVQINIAHSITRRIDQLRFNEHAGKCDITVHLDPAVAAERYVLHERAWNKLNDIIFDMLPILMANGGKKYAVRISLIPKESGNEVHFDLFLSDQTAPPFTAHSMGDFIDSLKTPEEEGDFFSEDTLTREDFVFITSCARYIANVDNIDIEVLAEYPFCSMVIMLPVQDANPTVLISDETLAL